MITHGISVTHKTETVCGRPVRRVQASPDDAEVTCRKCNPNLPKPENPTPPAHPLRSCDWVIVGATGLKLCGRYACEEHVG